MDELTVCEDVQQMSRSNFNISDNYSIQCPFDNKIRFFKSDCPHYKCLCNHPKYYGWMTAMCRKTCDRCDDSNEQSTQSPGHTRSPAANPDEDEDEYEDEDAEDEALTEPTVKSSTKKTTTAKTRPTKTKKTKTQSPTDDDEDTTTFATTSSEEEDLSTRTSPRSSRPGREKNKPSPARPLLPDTDHTTAVSPTQPSPASADCVDRVHPKTGASDCPKLQYLCDDEKYYELMTKKCPKTCNRCDEAE
ncbi:shTK domain protein [Ancylostoma duodenale]|uniref:ShTK domain protein n=1 Tax=Ancylostoma duodenale TaxID=51022 RepID=A0A0C2CI87_9BILA|nr:shTK domain protein [Ancylostoma duodenale]